MRVRTRIAPSPTGDPHVGTAYVGLVNYCFAHSNPDGGDFVLRVEDTDQVRSSAQSEAAIFSALHWCGLTWDEGPDKPGLHAPYRQSERTEIYRERLEQLLAQGDAFRCFCTPERLEEMRIAQRAAHQPPRYDGLCRGLTPTEVQEKLRVGAPFVVRMRVPDNERIAFDDVLRGRIEIESTSVDMQVLMKSDGYPTYHLANVVDDHLMDITHVIRGEEWISSTPKHILLYRYFGWQPPAFCHLPLLRNPDKSKLSKRKNPTGILYYKEHGYLAEALLHFLGMLIDSRNDDSLLDRTTPDTLLRAMCEHFELARISPGGPVFDLEKLRWLNGQHIRRHTPEEFMDLLRDWGYVWPPSIRNQDRLPIARIAQQRIGTLSEFGPLVDFFGTAPQLSRSDFASDKLSAGQIRELLFSAEPNLANLQGIDWNQLRIGDCLKHISTTTGLKFKDVVPFYYIAITGSPKSVPLFDAMEILGKDRSLQRLRSASEVLR